MTATEHLQRRIDAATAAKDAEIAALKEQLQHLGELASADHDTLRDQRDALRTEVAAATGGHRLEQYQANNQRQAETIRRLVRALSVIRDMPTTASGQAKAANMRKIAREALKDV